MADRFTVEMLPASDGDSLWVEWGDDLRPKVMVVDGGRGRATLARRLERLAADRRRIDLLVCTHLDADHIGGLLGVLKSPPGGLEIGEVWFNGFRHLPDDRLGYDQANRLSGILDEWVADGRTQWNRRWEQWHDDHGSAGLPYGAIVVPDRGPLPEIALEGMRITLLSPTLHRLALLAEDWDDWLKEAAVVEEAPVPDVGLAQDDDLLGIVDDDFGLDLAQLVGPTFDTDRTIPNGSSIAFVAEHAGRRVLFGADAHADVLVESLGRFGTVPVRLAACKLPHHGSASNTSSDLLDQLECDTWLVSTSGAYHDHPHRRTIARLVTRQVPTRLIFNYRRKTTEEWADGATQLQWQFDAVHPPKDGPQGVILDVLTGRAVPTAEALAGGSIRS